MRWTAAQFADYAAKNRARPRLTLVPVAKPPKPRLAGGGMIEFVIPGVPVPKGRPRFGKGHPYTPKKTVDAERVVNQIAAISIDVPIPGAAYVELVFYFPIPTQWSKAKRAAAVAGVVRPISGVDVDNALKLVCDGMNGIAYHDDAQIVDVRATKFYALEPRTIVRVMPHTSASMASSTRALPTRVPASS